MDKLARYEHFPDPLLTALATFAASEGGKIAITSAVVAATTAATASALRPGGAPDLPKLPDPVATPEVSAESEEATLKRIGQRRGFRKSILAGAVTPNTGKKTVLG